METKLNKVKQNFNKIKDIRVAVVNIFTTLEVKITKLKGLTNDFVKNNHETLFVFGLDSFMFQSKMIDFEYNDMQKYFLALNNRMYCEYYKLYKIVLEYIEQNNGISQNKTFEMIKANSKFPIYKDLEPYKQYNFDTIEEVHKTIISLLNIINDYIMLKDAELDAYKMKQYSGFNINNFVNTFDFNIVIVKQQLTLFMSYLEFFHNIHTKHFKRFSKKMKLMDDYINDDIQFDDSPRRKMSKDFDDSSSDGSSNVGGVPMYNSDNEKPHKALPRRSILKKGVDSVINGIKAFGSRKKPDADLTNNSSMVSVSNPLNNDVNLIISEVNSDISEAELNQENLAIIAQETSEIISEQLNKDPNLVSKMFDELTKTFDDDDKKSTKSTSSRGSRKSVKKEPVLQEQNEENKQNEQLEQSNTIATNTENDLNVTNAELDDTNETNSTSSTTNANKKKKKGKKK
jgi:hypothetical protein